MDVFAIVDALDPVIVIRLLAAAVTLGSGWIIWRETRGSRSIGGVLGLHLHVLLFYGLGGLTYTWADVPENFPQPVILAYVARAMVYIAGGYGIVVLLSAVRLARNATLDRARNRLGMREAVRLGLTNLRTLFAAYDSARLFWITVPLAVIGYVLQDSDVAHAGAGTILVVFQLFVYPLTSVAVILVGGQRRLTSALAFLYLSLMGYLVTFSTWRSRMVFFSCAVFLGLAIRSQRVRLYHVLYTALAIAIILPFAMVKKLQYEDVANDPIGAFVNTLQISVADRLDAITLFWGIRVNGAREAGYVLHGIETGRTNSQVATVYHDAMLQLIPRTLWPEKPSFNQTGGYYLPRDIGLVWRFDYQTTWGVDLFGEAGWTFGFAALLWYFTAAFLIAGFLDWVINRFIVSSSVAGFMRLVLFFQMLSIVQVGYQATFLLWALIVGALLDVVIRSRRDAKRFVPLPSPG